MFYYKATIKAQALEPLTYASKEQIELGSEVIVPLGNNERFATVVEESKKPEFICKEIVSLTGNKLTSTQLKTAKFIANYYSSHLSLAIDLFIPSKYRELDLITIDTAIKLSPKQSEALAFIDRPQPTLLFGDTGSGKSEIYMKLFEKVLNSGKTALFLMPEISLTPQIEKRLKNHFGDLVAIWHSKVTKAKKAKIIDQIYNGKVRVVAGARSALFLPMPNLGAIVVDEEHDDSYKSQSKPYYHTRDAAVVYGKELHIPVVLGSATPAVTSYAKFEHFRLNEQYFGSAQREFIFVDSSEDEPHQITLDLIRSNCAKGKQAIVFVPTRANFKYLLCKNCSSFIKCPFCEVGMSLYSHKNLIKCHYCNFATTIPTACPNCGNENLSANRHGTVEIISKIESAVGGVTIAQFDRDAITTDKKLRDTLKEFDSGKIDILVGTQMLSKGHDYHGVELAVILGLDHLLAMPDFRSAERAISLFLQIAGRAGRKQDAKVVVQTKNRGFFEPFINNYELFLKGEIASRIDLYPPHKRLLKLVISHKNLSKVKEKQKEILDLIRAVDGVEIVGYGECTISKIAQKFRHQILIRSSDIKALLTASALANDPIVDIEIDPLSFS